jgi:serine/threonine-protein kinase
VTLKDGKRKTVLEHGGMFPRYVPTGDLMYFAKGILVAVPFDLERLEVRGKPVKVLEEVPSRLTLGFAQLDFSRSGTLLYLKSQGLTAIQWLDAEGNTISSGAEVARYVAIRLSPDGARVAATVSDAATSNVWIYDWQRGSKWLLSKGLDAEGSPIWSPDGGFVVFESAGGMFWTRSDGAGRPQPLTRSTNLQIPGSFSPDGTRMAYAELIPGAGAEVRTVRLESSSGELRAVGEPETFLKTPTVSSFPAFSPDGRWLAYSNPEGGAYEVYVRAFPDNGAQWQISNYGGMIPVWSRSGHELYYRTEAQRIMVVDYSTKGGSFVAGKPRAWSGKQLANAGLIGNFDVASNGKRFAVLTPAGQEAQEDQRHIMLLLNFFDEVRRRVAP